RGRFELDAARVERCLRNRLPFSRCLAFPTKGVLVDKRILTCAALALAIPAFAKTDALSLIPNDAVTVGVVRVADMRSSPLSSALFQQTDQVSTHGDAQKFLTDAGLQPTRDIDLIMVATTLRTPLAHDAELVIA